MKDGIYLTTKSDYGHTWLMLIKNNNVKSELDIGKNGRDIFSIQVSYKVHDIWHQYLPLKKANDKQIKQFNKAKEKYETDFIIEELGK